MAFNTFFTEMILPFLLVFVVVFAVLQKTKLLGADKKQIDSITAFVIGLLVIGLPISRNFIVTFIPWLGIGLAVLLVFFILYGFVHGDMTTMPVWAKPTFAILAGLFTLGVLIYITGLWDKITGYAGDFQTNFWLSTFLLLVVVGAMFWIIMGGKTPAGK